MVILNNVPEIDNIVLKIGGNGYLKTKFKQHSNKWAKIFLIILIVVYFSCHYY